MMKHQQVGELTETLKAEAKLCKVKGKKLFGKYP